MESLPNWFLVLYLIFLFFSLITGLIGLIRQWFSNLSAMTIVFSLLAPLASLIFVVQRPSNSTVYEYVLSQLQAGDLWAIFITVLFLYLIAWNLFLLTYMIVKVVRIPYVKEKLLIITDNLEKQIKQLPFMKIGESAKSENVKSDRK